MRLNSRVIRLESAMRPIASEQWVMSEASRQACHHAIRLMQENPDLCTGEELEMLEELRRRRESEVE
jgi:hypothetical protein